MQESLKEDTPSKAIVKGRAQHDKVRPGEFADNAVSTRTKTTAAAHPKLWKEQCQRENGETGRGSRPAVHPVGAAMLFPN